MSLTVVIVLFFFFAFFFLGGGGGVLILIIHKVEHVCVSVEKMLDGYGYIPHLFILIETHTTLLVSAR